MKLNLENISNSIKMCKILRNKFDKNVQDLHTENYKTLPKMN
jgi:hypothetical protein